MSGPHTPERAYSFFQNVIVRPISNQLFKQGAAVPPEKAAMLTGLRTARFKAPGHMDVVVERINNQSQPFARISIASYYEQNGDLMRDPDIEVILSPSGNLYGVRFRNDGLGMDVEVKQQEGRSNTESILWSIVHINILEYLLDTWLPNIMKNYTLANVEWEE